MKITKKELEKIILEELEKNIEEGWFSDKIAAGVDALRSKFRPKPKEEPAPEEEPKSEEEPEGEDVDLSDLDGPAKPEEAEPESITASPQAAKAKDVFVQTAREFFNSHVRGKMRQQMMSMIASNLSADAERMARAKKKRGLAEQVTANSPRGQAFIIANAIMNTVEQFLSSITPEEFAKVFADVAQSKLKDDPKALKQALKSYRMAENMDKLSSTQVQAGLQVSSTFSQQLLNLMKLKGLDAAKLVKNAITSIPAEKMGMSQQQKNMVMGKMIGTLSKSLSDYFLGKKDNLKPVPSPVEFGPDKKEVPEPIDYAKPEPIDYAKPKPVDFGDDKKDKEKTKLAGGVPGKSPFAWSGGSAIKESKRLQKLAGILKD